MNKIKVGLKTIYAFILWLIYTPIVWVSKGAALLLAPIASLPMFIKVEANGREEISPLWKWTTTHDAPIDEFFQGNYFRRHKFMSRYTREEILDSGFLKWFGRICWIWRNPAYVVADWLGYDQTGMEFLYQKDEGHLWDSGHPNFSFYIAENAKGRIGWMLEWQWYFYKQRCLEVYLGWKLFRKDENKRCMIVSRITSKVYEKKFEI